MKYDQTIYAHRFDSSWVLQIEHPPTAYSDVTRQTCLSWTQKGALCLSKRREVREKASPFDELGVRLCDGLLREPCHEQ